MKTVWFLIVALALMWVALPVLAQSLYPSYSITADCFHWYAGTGASDTVKTAGFATIHSAKGHWTKIIIAIAPKVYKNTASRIRIDLCRDGALRGRFYFNYGGGTSLNFRADSISVHKTANTDTLDVYLLR